MAKTRDGARYLATPAAARYLGMTMAQVYYAMQYAGLPYRRTGAARPGYRFDRGRLDAWVRRRAGRTRVSLRLTAQERTLVRRWRACSPEARADILGLLPMLARVLADPPRAQR